ncbi:MAG: Beta-phosphoglucomutase [Promethearchaeota archaeon]|jgi:beta-phosphoglucomutase family hydrolase|nr:MAG: Beta-phosphoglucomutase [Candidatus Lokiarchaeota archaeon]
MSDKYLVIFDMDGVLADTGDAHYKSWKMLADEIGAEFNREFFEETFGQQSVPITRQLAGETPSDKKIKEWSDLKEKYYRRIIKEKLEPLPGVMELLNELKNSGFKLAVGSSGPPENVTLLLESLDIEDYFDVIISAADVSESKPAPDVFLKAAQKLNLEPKNTLVIEDAPVGIKSAKRANMKTVALTTTHPQDELMNADLILSDLKGLTAEKILNIIKK